MPRRRIHGARFVGALMKILQAELVVTSTEALENGWVAVDGDRIAAVGTGTPPSGDVERIDGWLIPGFVDIHVHGGGGHAFTDVGQASKVISTHRSHGTTRMLASLVSAPIPQLLKQIEELRPLVEGGELLGIHLEGPFLAESCKGAHDAHALIAPAPDVVEQILDAAQGTVRSVTLAPELEHGIEATKRFVKAGVLVSLGHSATSADLAHRAISAGAKTVTHLFNGMPRMHHREPGLIDEALLNPDVIVELILDGHHVSEHAAKLAMTMAKDSWIAVTDAMAAAGAPDGEYQLGAMGVTVTNGVATLTGGTSLAGSTLTMDRVFSRLISVYHCTPSQAVNATASLPSRVLGQSHDLAAGNVADLLVWNSNRVDRVMRSGDWS